MCRDESGRRRVQVVQLAERRGGDAAHRDIRVREGSAEHCRRRCGAELSERSRGPVDYICQA
jgi:hypothetical protein